MILWWASDSKMFRCLSVITFYFVYLTPHNHLEYPMGMTFGSLKEFSESLSSEVSCRKYFDGIRFVRGEFCPHCSHGKIHHFADGRYRCASCKRDFTIKTGTIFGESKVPLCSWFLAIYLLTTNKDGISSIELSRQVGVSQKTAWFMDRRIRSAMKQRDEIETL